MTTILDTADDHSGPVLIATVGLPASGKTTWTLEQLRTRARGTIARCNRDELRRSTQGTPRYDAESEAVITVIQHDLIAVLLRTGHTVIVDDTNLSNVHRQALAVIAGAAGATYAEQDFRHIPLETCIARDRARIAIGGHVGEHVIRDMHARYLAPLSTQEAT
jgi:predicted kinase